MSNAELFFYGAMLDFAVAASAGFLLFWSRRIIRSQAALIAEQNETLLQTEQLLKTAAERFDSDKRALDLAIAKGLQHKLFAVWAAKQLNIEVCAHCKAFHVPGSPVTHDPPN